MIWVAFSAFAALGQWGLHRAALLSPMMISTSPVLGGTLLIAAGIFQWTPLKNTCLTHCRSPLDFFSSHWREGTSGALSMGLRQRSLLRGLLLGLDGSFIRGRRYESSVDCFS